MLTKICKSKLAAIIRQQLFRVPVLNRHVKSCLIKRENQRIIRETRRIERQLERHHLRWELIMGGQALWNIETEKPDHRTLADVTDSGVVISYMNGREVGQEYAGPTFHRLDTVNWGGM